MCVCDCCFLFVAYVACCSLIEVRCSLFVVCCSASLLVGCWLLVGMGLSVDACGVAFVCCSLCVGCCCLLWVS